MPKKITPGKLAVAPNPHRRPTPHRFIVGRCFVSELSEPAPHAHPVEECIEPQYSLRFRVIDRSISFEQRLVTPRVFMRRAEQGLRQVEQTVGGACITEIDKAAQSKPAVVETARRQQIALMEVIVAEHRSRVSG